ATPTPEARPVTNFGVLQGKVAGLPGNPLPEKADINLKSLKGAFNTKSVSGADGSFKFDNVPPGEYILIVLKQGFQEARRQLLIKAGDTTESVVELVPVNGSVSGRVIDPAGKPLAEIAIAIDKGKKTRTDKDGRFSFNDLSAGYH